MAGILPLRPNKLIFPGSTGAVDFAHPASKNLKLSAIAVAGGQGNFVDLTSGKSGTNLAANTTFGIDGTLGPFVDFPQFQVNVGSSFSGRDSTNYTSSTLAAIVRLDVVNDFQFFVTNSSGGSGVALGIDNTGQIQWTMYGVVAENSGLILSAGVPYFVVASQSPGNINYLVRRLDNGKIVTATSSSATPSAPNGTYLIGQQPSGSGRPAEARIAAGSYSAAYLSMPQLLQWAQDPWSFWYPQKLDLAQAIKAPAGGTLPFVPNSNDNFNVRQTAQRAAAALLIVTQPFVPFNTTQVAPTVAKGWYNQLSSAAKKATAQPTQPTSFAVPPSAAATPQQFGWYQPLSKSVPVARANLGSTFVPFNTTQVVQTIVRGWYGQTTSAVRVAIAQPTQPTSFAVPASVAPPAQTPGQFGWWANLSKSAPVAQAKPGNTFVPFNTAQVVISPQTVPLNYDAGSVQQRVVYYQSSFQVLRPIAVTPNTITGIAWFQPLGVPAPVAQAKPGSTFVPLNTRQVNSITGIGWYQNLSRPAPVAIAQAGFSFVPFNTKQVVTVQVAFDPFVKKRSKPKRDRLRDELEIKYKRRLAIEEAFWPPTTYELPPYKLPEHVKPAPDVSDLANVIMQVQQMRAAQARQQDEDDEKALLELLKREYGIEDV